MFRQRAFVTLTLGPLGLLLIYLGGWFFFVPVLILFLIGTTEYAKLSAGIGWELPLWLMLPSVFFLHLDAQFFQGDWAAAILVLSFLAVLGQALWRYERNRSTLSTGEWLASMGGIILLGWLGSHLLLIRNLDDIGQWAFTAILAIWGADTFAYLVGSRIGRRKMVPRLSPKKSWEGYLGGVILGPIVPCVVAFFFFPDVSLSLCIPLTLFLTVIAPAGDLAFSLLKRESGVKDSGQLFPGHGGAVDRLDSIMWGVTIAYYLILLIR